MVLKSLLIVNSISLPERVCFCYVLKQKLVLVAPTFFGTSPVEGLLFSSKSVVESGAKKGGLSDVWVDVLAAPNISQGQPLQGY